MIPRILFVHSNGDFTTRVHRVLSENTNFMVQTLNQSHDLKESIEKSVPDIVVVSSDCASPENIVNARENRFLTEAPSIVVLSENENPKDRAAYLAVGCDACISDSFSTSEVKAIFKNLVHKKEALLGKVIEIEGRNNEPKISDFVSKSATMKTFMEMVRKVLKGDSSILFLGETGVGKERLARAIHSECHSRKGPFVAVNCGALSETLLESELFGHEKGAFTGATRLRRGIFEMAHKGTVFLDEIAEMPLHLQVKLLRVLQEREVQRVGGERALHVDVRVMAASNRHLVTEVKEGKFRQDLYYRLNVITLEVPPLRQRREDIEELANSAIQHFRKRLPSSATRLDPKVVKILKDYSWPGNVRELLNVIERAMLLSGDNAITLAELPNDILQSNVESQKFDFDRSRVGHRISDEWMNKPIKEFRRQTMDHFERIYLDHLLSKTQGRIGIAAKLAGIQPRALFERMRYFGLKKEYYRKQSNVQ
ncbi:MAG: sigma-54-dependent Fis family transcriptional regulator [Bdellovibrionales bacterium]|nr:sigma-54-dependent Fis family transcriptional regulator [Bdellovibrionales bacterium]